MNTSNNRRRQASRGKMERVFIELLQSREISDIRVADICKRAQLNRSTFYANYADIYELADTIRDKLEGEVSELFGGDIVNNGGVDYLSLFRHIRDNQLFYKTYFKLGYDHRHSIDLGLLDREHRLFPAGHLAYHVEFHKAGLNAVIKRWLDTGCKESPETIAEIIKAEYRGREPE